MQSTLWNSLGEQQPIKKQRSKGIKQKNIEFFVHKKYFWRRTSLQIFSFPNAHYSSGIGDHLLPRTFKEWSCQVCTTLLIPLKFWFHLHFSQKLNECSLSPLLHVLMVHCMLCSLCQCSCVCKCITTHTEKFQWLKSCGSPLYPQLFLDGSVPDPIHCTDTQTAVSVWRAENVWEKRKGGLDKFHHHWHQTRNHKHEWLL